MKPELKKTALAAAIALLAGVAKAGPLSWTEASAGYVRADSVVNTRDGYELSASVGLAQLYHVSLRYVDGSEGGSFTPDFSRFQVRLGIHPGVGENTQAIAEVFYFNDTYDNFGPVDTGADGWGVGFGMRHQIGDKFEVKTQIDWYDGSRDSDFPYGLDNHDYSSTVLELSGRYYWIPEFFTGVGMWINGANSFGGDVISSGSYIQAEVGYSFGGDIL